MQAVSGTCTSMALPRRSAVVPSTHIHLISRELLYRFEMPGLFNYQESLWVPPFTRTYQPSPV